MTRITRNSLIFLLYLGVFILVVFLLNKYSIIQINNTVSYSDIIAAILNSLFVLLIFILLQPAHEQAKSKAVYVVGYFEKSISKLEELSEIIIPGPITNRKSKDYTKLILDISLEIQQCQKTLKIFGFKETIDCSV